MAHVLVAMMMIAAAGGFVFCSGLLLSTQPHVPWRAVVALGYSILAMVFVFVAGKIT